MFSLIVTIVAMAVITLLSVLALYYQASYTEPSTPWLVVAVAAWAITETAQRFIQTQRKT